MKIDDLVIFVEVAKAPSLRSAACKLNVQPGTLSKTIKRVESYYQQELFSRSSSHWKLTSAGETLFQRAIELIAINDKIERELGKPRRPHLRICGSETLLSYFVPQLVQRMVDKELNATLETKTAQDLEALRKHDADLALVARLNEQTPVERQIAAQPIKHVNFVTVANSHHPLAQLCEEPINIKDVLKYPFIVPSSPIYGSMDAHRSLDGWHDEHFSRLITARVDTASMLIAMIKSKPLLAYLPDYMAKEHKLHIIDIVGCPYTCKQTIWLCRHKQIHHHWIHIFD
ncbi:LysR family transcriptional regulator [Vibrio marisflavi]|uniref:HTH lysR-type domain-containing protein n=1 Tax=Vibrio marisflavi CECT 7928 TaxID=634439 RepID=A0ABM9A243_9VIBR|nr:LysR family transcriptional regulator [Vibrio marisflavi]CAH0537770.1 hypothetical protein VMF7928_01323 [Vibrio marisflavi CECT 7928]